MIVIIDNYDSFTYNIVQTIADNCRDDRSPEDIKVFRNDKITIEGLQELKPRRILISPGPCTPTEAGCSLEVAHELTGEIPLLGV